MLCRQARGIFPFPGDDFICVALRDITVFLKTPDTDSDNLFPIVSLNLQHYISGV